ncbi:MAG TPA: hypothetical protein VGA69_06905 [Nitriliruptorales bacterium]
MAEHYTSRIALVLDRPVEHVGQVVDAAVRVGDIDRASSLRGQPHEAMEVHWGGRMQRGVVRRVGSGTETETETEGEGEGDPLLRTETLVGGDGVTTGLQRQARLLQALSRQLPGRVQGVRDLSALVDRDEAWMNRVAIGAVELDDAIISRADGEGTWWVSTHGAARFDVVDLELYGLPRSKVDAARELVAHVHTQLLGGPGLKVDLTMKEGTPIYLVPVLEAWQHLPLDWPGIGKAGQDRGPGLDGPRATLSVLHRKRLGRYRKDFEGVIDRL